MASLGGPCHFLLSALSLFVWHGMPNLGVKDLILLCGQISLLLTLPSVISLTTSWLNSFKSSQVYLKEEEKNENRPKKNRHRVRPGSLSSGRELGADEDLLLENESQTSFNASCRAAAKRSSKERKLVVLDLPEEPLETAEQVVAALRCPSGSFLFDWMMKIRYHTYPYMPFPLSFPEGLWKQRVTGYYRTQE
ncbi:unnamed protein product [Nyctereutes procyonoides]|uniref:(raccoon dog) hypothetical protein n=1 Tax=Nyctereutes procyonoides TaxID=34880 RepID=A0A811YZM5_NYCPR|nr:unnamed protein product [Nyctereutes procyonoides]